MQDSPSCGYVTFDNRICAFQSSVRHNVQTFIRYSDIAGCTVFRGAALSVLGLRRSGNIVWSGDLLVRSRGVLQQDFPYAEIQDNEGRHARRGD
jgi:hypothetical protein